MKNIIFQYFISHNGVGKDILFKHFPKEMPEWVKRSSEYFKRYARTHKTDYLFSTSRYIKSSSNFFECLRVIKDPLFDDYDTVLYVDVDVMPKDFSKNIFEVEFGDIAGWPEWRHPDLAVPVNWSAKSTIRNRFAHFGAPIIKPKTNPLDIRVINTGVVLWSKEARFKARNKFIDHEKWFHYKNPILDKSLKNVGHSSQCLDQPYLNAMWSKFGFEVTELPIEWNRLPTKNEERPCYFAHYLQNYRFDIPKLFPKLPEDK